MKIIVKFLLIVLIVKITLIAAQRPMTKEEAKNEKYATKFRAVQCYSHDNSSAYFTFCYIKAYSRKFSTLNFGIRGLKDWDKPDFYVRIIAYYRYGNIYREIIDSKTIDWCKIIDGIDSNPFIKFEIEIFRKSAPKIFQKCPYEQPIEFYNLTIDDEVAKKLQIFPEGQYKYLLKMSPYPDKTILELTFFTETRSPDKKSFG